MHFKDLVENKLKKKIKVVRSDRGGEFYGKQGPLGRIPRPFARFLQESGIEPQYSMPGTPQ